MHSDLVGVAATDENNLLDRMFLRTEGTWFIQLQLGSILLMVHVMYIYFYFSSTSGQQFLRFLGQLHAHEQRPFETNRADQKEHRGSCCLVWSGQPAENTERYY